MGASQTSAEQAYLPPLLRPTDRALNIESPLSDAMHRQSARHLTLDLDGAFKLAYMGCPNELESFQNLADMNALRYA